MKLSRVLIIGISVLMVSGCGTMKRKKFLDFFTTYKLDTLSVTTIGDYTMYTNPNAAWELRGTYIDTSFHEVFSRDEAEDIRQFTYDPVDKAPAGYYKVKLDLGYYFVVIRAGGEYWNSRFYGCLYHSGENKITHTVLLSEYFGDAGATFLCNAFIEKNEKTWKLTVHEYFSEPVDYDKFYNGTMDSIQVREADITYQIENVDDRYNFVEKERKAKAEVTK